MEKMEYLIAYKAQLLKRIKAQKNLYILDPNGCNLCKLKVYYECLGLAESFIDLKKELL